MLQKFQIESLIGEAGKRGQAWTEFLRQPSLSMGLYCLKTGQVDKQRPHTEDEVYYVLKGRASFQSGDERHEVMPGTVIFVERLVEHRFFDIIDDLTVLVFFAPPEGSLAEGVRAT
jgi:quercetin dioxygenase-like cupin family protein